MIDEKPTDGTNTSKKDQDGHEMMKSENFKGVLYIHSPNPDDELKNFVLSRWSWSDECWFFFWQFFWDSYTCSSDYSVYDGRCTYTHLLHAHFSAHGACTVTFAHLHARMAQLSVKRCLHMCRFSPSRLLPSHVSPIFAVPARSLRDHSWLRLHWRSRPHVLAVLTCPKSAGHAPRRTCIAKFGFRPCSMELSELGQFDLGQWG